MKCPSCRDVELDERYRHGTEVDVCPRCKGIWLDRNELDRLLASAESGDPDAEASSGDITPADLALLSEPTGDNRDDQDNGKAHEDHKQRAKPAQRDNRDRPDERDEHADRPDREKHRAKRRRRSRTERLGDLLEDILDEIFD